MEEIIGSITISTVLTSLIMTGSLWGMLLIARMLSSFTQRVPHYARNIIRVRNSRNS